MKALPDCEKLLMTDVVVCIFFLFGDERFLRLSSAVWDNNYIYFGFIQPGFLQSSCCFKKKKKKKVGSRATQEAGVSPAHKWDPNNDHLHSIQLENV